MGPTISVMFGKSQDAPVPSRNSGSEYDFPLFKAMATARRYAASSAQAKLGKSSERAVSALKAAPQLAPAVSFDSGTGRTTSDWDRCQRLIEVCRSLCNGDPETLLLTASLAVTLTNGLDSGRHGQAALADLQAYAAAELANARRINNDLLGAESELARGMVRAGEGTGSPQLLAQLMDLTASLFVDQGRMEDARCLLDAVYAIHQREGDRHSSGRALISKGFLAINSVEEEEGIRLLIQGLGMIDAAREPRLTMSGIFNLIWSLVECGRAPQAESLYEECRQLFADGVEKKDGIKFLWLEGRIAAALKDAERAETRLCEARAAFEEFKVPAYVALVSLDLAALWLPAGRTAEIMELIEETIAIFRAHGMSRDAITSLLIVREAFTSQKATEALLRTTAAELLRHQYPFNRRDRVLG